jgi:hypothetical protein
LLVEEKVSDSNTRDKRNDTVFINYDEVTRRKLDSTFRDGVQGDQSFVTK